MPGLHLIKSPRGLGVGAVVLGTALVAGGCGAAKRNANPDLIAGKVQFVQRCGACHTLAHAGSKGVIGPNLDYAFAQSLADGERRAAVESVVHGQILFPNPRGVMPANLAHGKVADDIASYVAQVADAPGQDTGLLLAAVQAPGGGKPAVEATGRLEIDADPTGQLAYLSQKATAKPGPVTIVMKNQSTQTHNIALQQGTSGPLLGNGPVVAKGGLSSFKASLKPGTYTYFCQVPGHRAGGMVGTLTVK